ncbi:MAG: site-specific integrase [Defluviitaleaceae bacterium]|nr:site-specific integrase [Defluviitaleaceae bacterium]MCL2273642.1 site-specific integrase [Defluviitaleaceae bacterium]
MPQQIKKSKSKAGRRGNNEGSIYQRKDGRWAGAVITGYKTDGRPIRTTVYGKTRNEVAAKVAEKTNEVYVKGYTNVSARDDTGFQILCKEWFDIFIAPGLASVTEEHRRMMMRNHLFPEFGKFDIKDVDTKRLQRFFNAKTKTGLSADFIGKMKYLLNNFFKYAMKQNYVTSNPVEDVVVRKAGGKSSSEKSGKALRPEIRENVMAQVMENPILKPIIITFTLTGLRPQELIALVWENINIENKSISVKQAVNRTREFDSEGNVISKGVKIGKTKTPKSVRTIVMPDAVVEALQEWKHYCKANDIHSAFVFPNTTTGEMRTYSGLRSNLERFKKRHGLQNEKISLYTFRHTYATILLEQRENPKIVANLMGHTRVSTTLDLYSHVVDDEVYKQTARTLDGAFKGLTKKNPPDSSTV